MRGALSLGARRGRRLAAGLALVVAVAVVIGIVLTAGSPPRSSAASNPATASGAATVQRRDLVQTDTESGTLSYANPRTAYDRLSGTVTWLPGVGQVIKPGATLYRVDGEPVTLMNGSTPAYRALDPSDSAGPDILQLNRNLVALGFNASAITIDDVWRSATTLGVELFQESIGEAATGSLALGQIVFLPGNQLISAVDGTLGSTGGGGATTSGSGSVGASARVGALAPQFVSLKTVPCPTTTPGAASQTTTTGATATGPVPCAMAPVPPTIIGAAPTHRRPGVRRRGRPGRSVRTQTLAALLALLRAEIAENQAQRRSSGSAQGSGSRSGGGSGQGKGSGSRSGGGSGQGKGSGRLSGSGASGSGSSGGSGGSAEAILQTTSTRLVVTVDLGASVQSEAVIGEHVTVEMPAGTTVAGTVTAVSPVAQNSSASGSGSGGSGSGSSGGGSGGGGSGAGGSSGSSSTIPVTITLRGHHTGAGLDQAAVSVNFVKQRASNVLSVPVTALLATSGGNYAIQTAATPHRLIPVTPGLFAAGDVQISGPGVYPGLRVTDSQG